MFARLGPAGLPKMALRAESTLMARGALLLAAVLVASYLGLGAATEQALREPLPSVQTGVSDLVTTIQAKGVRMRETLFERRVGSGAAENTETTLPKRTRGIGSRRSSETLGNSAFEVIAPLANVGPEQLLSAPPAKIGRARASGDPHPKRSKGHRKSLDAGVVAPAVGGDHDGHSQNEVRGWEKGSKKGVDGAPDDDRAPHSGPGKR